jgi:hypothetical protein
LRQVGLVCLLGVATAGAQEIHDPLDEPTGAGPTVTAPAAAAVTASMSGYAWLELAEDTRLDNGREAAGGMRGAAALRLSVAPNARLRAVAEARVRYDVAVERNESHAPFLLVNGEHARAWFEATPGECFVELAASDWLRLSAGLEIFRWGQTDFASPADPLNPRDLRWGLPVEPAEVKVPVPAVAAGIELGAAHLDLVWLPFFTPARAWLTGHDYALLSPGGSQLPADFSGLLPAELADALQTGVLGGFAPAPGPASSSLAARVSGRAAGVDLAAGTHYGWDLVPTVHLDHDLAQAVIEAASPEPRLLTIATLLARLYPRAAAGERLASGEHQRQLQVFAEAGAALGPLVLKLDAAFADGQTFYTTADGAPLTPVRHPTLATAVAVDGRIGERLFATVQLSSVHLFDVGADEDLVLFAPTLHELVALVRGAVWPGRLDGQVTALLGLTQGDWVLQPLVTWRASPSLTVAAGLSLFEGNARGLGGFFAHTSEAFVRARAAF